MKGMDFKGRHLSGFESLLLLFPAVFVKVLSFSKMLISSFVKQAQ